MMSEWKKCHLLKDSRLTHGLPSLSYKVAAKNIRIPYFLKTLGRALFWRANDRFKKNVQMAVNLLVSLHSVCVCQFHHHVCVCVRVYPLLSPLFVFGWTPKHQQNTKKKTTKSPLPTQHPKLNEKKKQLPTWQTWSLQNVNVCVAIFFHDGPQGFYLRNVSPKTWETFWTRRDRLDFRGGGFSLYVYM